MRGGDDPCLLSKVRADKPACAPITMQQIYVGIEADLPGLRQTGLLGSERRTGGGWC